MKTGLWENEANSCTVNGLGFFIYLPSTTLLIYVRSSITKETVLCLENVLTKLVKLLFNIAWPFLYSREQKYFGKMQFFLFICSVWVLLMQHLTHY